MNDKTMYVMTVPRDHAFYYQKKIERAFPVRCHTQGDGSYSFLEIYATSTDREPIPYWLQGNIRSFARGLSIEDV